MYRFLSQPRWIAGHVLLFVAVVAFVNLGLWQLRRLEERQARNALVSERLAAAPRPLDDVLTAADGDPELARFRRVEVDGTFVPTGQLLTAPRSLDGRPGQQVLAVLARDDGPALLVDRGWIPFDRAARPPPLPDGRVRIVGVVRAPEPGPIGDGSQVARISPGQIAERIGGPLEAVYVQTTSQRPPPPDALRPTPVPELTEGSHRAYAVQWFSFALIALVGYPVLIWRTARPSRRRADDADDSDARPRRSTAPAG